MEEEKKLELKINSKDYYDPFAKTFYKECEKFSENISENISEKMNEVEIFLYLLDKTSIELKNQADDIRKKIKDIEAQDKTS